ncbi:hypothetical protein MTE01_03750 [Microbacterium testaceum]|uniref:Protein-glutamine gamma-glutamyltransferase-like C-terminal domain-containing protein n=2 Tax=Microbacterium testaceum TaxID=2033 RepID=A0A4Y3QJQ4_MICTE|nr:hypothetical protein MTE01_03750 [Microbacterium testaceum]
MILTAMAAAFPLLPDPDQARDWAEQELGDPVYQAAEPNVVDRISQAIGKFLEDLLRVPDNDGWGPSALVVLGIIVVALIVVALLIWGRPRLSTRASEPARALFDDDDDGRSADDLRADATVAADRGEWDDAIVLRFRAFARGLTERGLVDPPPGATVRAFARETATALPALVPLLDPAATTFDDIRYLRRPGTRERYRQVADLDDAAVRARVVPVASR